MTGRRAIELARLPAEWIVSAARGNDQFVDPAEMYSFLYLFRDDSTLRAVPARELGKAHALPHSLKNAGRSNDFLGSAV